MDRQSRDQSYAGKTLCSTKKSMAKIPISRRAADGSCWKTGHGIDCNAISGEIKSADSDAADEYPPKLREIVEEGGYSEEQVYNCDETGLMYKMLPRNTLSMKSDPSKREGIKEAKERGTILLTVNKTGKHKLKPLCIGKFQNLQAFHHINRKTLPCVYDHSNNA